MINNYKELDNFVKRSRDLSRKLEKPSVYWRAIVNGILEILSVYKSVVLHVEQKLLSDHIPILATVTHGLNKVATNWHVAINTFNVFQFFVFLPPFHELIVEIEHDDVRGGQLLNLLHRRCHCGVPELQACIQRYDCIIQKCRTSFILTPGGWKARERKTGELVFSLEESWGGAYKDILTVLKATQRVSLYLVDEDDVEDVEGHDGDSDDEGLPLRGEDVRANESETSYGQAFEKLASQKANHCPRM
ncbi:hypothetical protein GIB67_042047 [Kingdonia uniflora]|uniref:Gamma-tubulin complex component n=1 Tax=Kingdonia uniflora TaxID=39325 RepID=A0A7J7MVS4_9MAGN|nr:hypothetical protein GIB67_042047 [Kingdonia uniflora]